MSAPAQNSFFKNITEMLTVGAISGLGISAFILGLGALGGAVIPLTGVLAAGTLLVGMATGIAGLTGWGEYVAGRIHQREMGTLEGSIFKGAPWRAGALVSALGFSVMAGSFFMPVESGPSPLADTFNTASPAGKQAVTATNSTAQPAAVTLAHRAV